MSDTRPTSKARIYLMAAIIAVVIGVTYASSFSGVFLFDDLVHIVNNKRIQEVSSLPALLSGKRPVVDVTLAVNYAIGQSDAKGYHAFNIVIHVLASLTLFGLIRRTLAIAARHRFSESAMVYLAAAIALLWGIHPLQTQSVTYLIQRAESMMGLFYLLTLYCFVRGATGIRTTPWFAASIAACALGMGCKAVMITAPIVVLLFDRIFLSDRWQDILRRRATVYLGLAATWLVLWATGIAGGVMNASTKGAHVGFGFKGVTPLEYLQTQAGVLVTYIKLALWPYPLCLDYGWPLASGVAQIAVPGVLVLAIIALAIAALHKRYAPGFLALFFLIVLAPTSSIVPIKDMFFEHRMYLPLAAIVTAFILGGYTLANRLRFNIRSNDSYPVGLTTLTLLIITCALCIGTMTRNKTYASPILMWQDVASKRPSNARAFENLGTQWMGVGDRQAAINAYEHAVQANPDFVSAQVNLGNALLETGNPQKAADHFAEAVRVDPNHIMANVNRGYALQRIGHNEKAIASFLKATQVEARANNRRPLANAHFALGTAYARKGLFDDATPVFQRAIALWPEYQKAHYTLGVVHERNGMIDEAINAYRQALALNPNDAKVQNALTKLLVQRTGG